MCEGVIEKLNSENKYIIASPVIILYNNVTLYNVTFIRYIKKHEFLTFQRSKNFRVLDIYKCPFFKSPLEI